MWREDLGRGTNEGHIRWQLLLPESLPSGGAVATPQCPSRRASADFSLRAAEGSAAAMLVLIHARLSRLQGFILSGRTDSKKDFLQSCSGSLRPRLICLRRDHTSDCDQCSQKRLHTLQLAVTAIKNTFVFICYFLVHTFVARRAEISTFAVVFLLVSAHFEAPSGDSEGPNAPLLTASIRC